MFLLIEIKGSTMISKQILSQIFTIFIFHCKTCYIKDRKYSWVEYLEIFGFFALI